MSIHVMSWVFRHSDEKLGRRLTLLALSEFAHDDGTKAFPAVSTLVERTRLSERQVQNCLRELQVSGAITKTGQTQRGVAIYRVNMGANIAPLAAEGVQSTTGITSRIAPDPSEPRKDLSAATDAHEQIAFGGIDVHPKPEQLVKTVARKKVNAEEYAMAEAVLATYNAVFKPKIAFTGREWLADIIGRLREHPDLTLDDHRAVMEKQFANPWWTSSPTPGVVYGNGKVFDRALNAEAKTEDGPDLSHYDRT